MPPAPATPRRRRSERLLDVGLARRGRGAVSAIYGTILVTALIAALSEDASAGPGDLALATGATAVVFWLAHAYAEVLGERVGDPRHWRGVPAVLEDEWPIAESAVLPVVVFALASAGVWSRGASVAIALVVALLELAAWGFLAGRRMGTGPGRALLAAAVNVLLGCALVALKALIH